MTIEEILQDAENFPDEYELPFGAEKVKLGDLRNKIRGYDSGFTKKMQELSVQQARVSERELATTQAFEKLTQQQADLSRIQQEFRQQGATPAQAQVAAQALWDWEHPDPYIEPVVKRFGNVDRTLNESMQNLNQIRDAVVSGIKWMAQREREREWSSLPERPEDLTIDALQKYALDNRLVDDVGFPLYRQAYDRMTEPKRRAAEIDKIKIDATKEAERKARQPERAPMSRPGLTVANAAKPKFNGNLRQLFQESIRNDPTIRESLFDAGMKS